MRERERERERNREMDTCVQKYCEWAETRLSILSKVVEAWRPLLG